MNNLWHSPKDETDEDHGLVDSREISVHKSGETIDIQDITQSQVQLFDSLNLVDKIVEHLSSHGNPQFSGISDKRFQEMKKAVFLNWFNYDFSKKTEVFNKYTSHEVNFFLFKKDPEFYSKVVKVFVQNKMEKMLVDYYMLAMDKDTPN